MEIRNITIATSHFRKSRLITIATSHPIINIFDTDNSVYDVFNNSVKRSIVRKPLRMPFKNMKARTDVCGDPLYKTKALYIKEEIGGLKTTIRYNQTIINYIMGLPDNMRVYFGLDEFCFYKKKKRKSKKSKLVQQVEFSLRKQNSFFQTTTPGEIDALTSD